MSGQTDYLVRRDRARPAEVVAGYLSALAIFMSLIGIIWHPLRLIPVAMLLALIGAGMAGASQRLPRAAALICAASFFLGLTVSVVTSKPLW